MPAVRNPDANSVFRYRALMAAPKSASSGARMSPPRNAVDNALEYADAMNNAGKAADDAASGVGIVASLIARRTADP